MRKDEETILSLQSRLREAEEERRKAAQYGLELMESQNLLQNRLDKLQNEMVTMTEVSLLKLDFKNFFLFILISVYL